MGLRLVIRDNGYWLGMGTGLGMGTRFRNGDWFRDGLRWYYCLGMGQSKLGSAGLGGLELVWERVYKVSFTANLLMIIVVVVVIVIIVKEWLVLKD